MNCVCAQQELWDWLQDHEKLVSDSKNLRCELPPGLRARYFLKLNPSEFCETPLVIKLTIQDIRPSSIIVSWQSRNHSDIYGYRVVFSTITNEKYTDNTTVSTYLSLRSGVNCLLPNEIPRGNIIFPSLRRKKFTKNVWHHWKFNFPFYYGNSAPGLSLRIFCFSGSSITGLLQANSKEFDSTITSVQLSTLFPSTRYLVCVFGLTRWTTQTHSNNASKLSDDYFGRCIEVRTLDTGEDDHRRRNPAENSFLTRRLGLIIGSCMGCVVFIILVIILILMKVKKQRKKSKNARPLPPEYLSYRHFSLQGCDPLKMYAQRGATITWFGIVDVTTFIVQVHNLRRCSNSC